MADQVTGTGISFPPKLGPDGRMATSSGAESVRESIRVILSTDFEERLMRPSFGGGLRRYLFEPNTVSTRRQIEERVRRALTRWEPRIELEDVAAEEAPDDPDEAVLTLVYRIRATGARRQTRLTVELAQ